MKMLTKTRLAMEAMLINRRAAAYNSSTSDYSKSGPEESSAIQVALRKVSKNDEAILKTSDWCNDNVSELKLEDKVSVADERAVFLQGLVVYVGKVHFCAQGIWVGIQLTGPSIGRGNCDGSYDGRKYFSHVGKNNGYMAPLNKVNKRIQSVTGDIKIDKQQKLRSSERARMADLQFIDCLVQERQLAMLKLDETRKKKGLGTLFSSVGMDSEETHITRLKQMRIADLMRSRDIAIPESERDLEVSAPNLKYSPPESKLQSCDLEFAEGLEMTQQNYCLSDPTLPDNPIVYASQPFLNMTKYNLNDILGKNCRFLQGLGTDKYAVYRLRLSIKEGADCHACLLNYRKDGTKFYNRLFMTALRCTAGRIKYYLGVQCEVSEDVAKRINKEERDKLERNLSKATLISTAELSNTSLNISDESSDMDDTYRFNDDDSDDDDDTKSKKSRNSKSSKSSSTKKSTSTSSSSRKSRDPSSSKKSSSSDDKLTKSSSSSRSKSTTTRNNNNNKTPPSSPSKKKKTKKKSTYQGHDTDDEF